MKKQSPRNCLPSFEQTETHFSQPTVNSLQHRIETPVNSATTCDIERNEYDVEQHICSSVSFRSCANQKHHVFDCSYKRFEINETPRHNGPKIQLDSCIIGRSSAPLEDGRCDSTRCNNQTSNQAQRRLLATISDGKRRGPLTEDDVHKTFTSPGRESKLHTGADDGGGVNWKSMAKLLLMRICRKIGKVYQKFTCVNFLRHNIPIIDVIRSYKLSFIHPDITGGLSEGIMHVPMGMSYALLAEVPPQYGLYNSLVYPAIYTLLGTSRQASVGVSSIEALLCSEAVDAVIGSEASGLLRVHTTIALSLCVGLVLIIMRFLALGIISNILADPVLGGFCTAGAFLIGTSQLKYVFGMSVNRAGLPKTWWYIMTHINEANWVTFGIATVSVIILSICKVLNNRYFKKFPLPGQFVIVIISTLVVYLGKWNMPPYSVQIVGDIPTGLPRAEIPHLTKEIFPKLFKESISLAAMYFVIHVSITKSIAQSRNYFINADQELLALGTCNIFGSFFQCFPNATSLSRSSVINSIGTKTVFHSIASICVVILTLTCLTPLLYYLPYSALAAIVLVGVAGMIDFGEGVWLLGLLAPDFVLWLAAFLGTSLLGAMEGIIISVALSLLWLLWKSLRPTTAVLGVLPDTTIYRNVKRFPMATETAGLKIFRFDASLNFSNADYFETRLYSLHLEVNQHTAADVNSKYLTQLT